MKKTISINIAGIVFYIEEDGYDKLNAYLTSIQQYFANYEGNKEIIEDIENRIAEIFYAKITPSNQVITLEDVEALIATMGTVADFEAAETEETTNRNNSQTSGQNTYNTHKTTNSGEFTGYSSSRQLFRDEKRKVLGGVCTGLAHYLRIDPVWVKLIFVLGTLAYGSFLILYGILWIAVPGSMTLEEDTKVKKFFRNPENKVIGGVIGGIASYFGAEPNAVTLMRVFWAASVLFFGFGLLAYIILFLITPEAKTITEKMQMQGEPVTLSNIEENIKRTINEPTSDKESTLATVLLFPFRIIAQVFKALGPVAGYVVGLFLILVAVSVILPLFTAFGTVLGFWHTPWMHFAGIPPEFVKNSIPVVPALFGLLATVIPFFFFIFLGVLIITRKNLVTRTTALVLVGLWILSLVGLGVSVPQFFYDFKRSDIVEKSQNLASDGKVLYLTAKYAGNEDYGKTNLTIKGYEGNVPKLVQKFEAQGRTREDAQRNAQMIEYKFVQQDSVITFNTNFDFKEDFKFRAQRLKMILYVPYNQKFMVSDIFETELLDNGNIQPEKVYQFIAQKGLNCVSCPDNEKNDSSEPAITSDSISESGDFENIEVSGAFEVEIRKGDKHSVKLQDEKYRDKVDILTEGNTLKISYNEEEFWRKFNHKRRIKIKITLPELKDLDLTGATKAEVSGFSNTDDMNIALTGACDAEVSCHTSHMKVNVTGASKLRLSGTASHMEVDVTGASHLDAFDFQAEEINAEVSGASHANVYASKVLNADANGASHLRYKGDPKDVKTDVGMGGSVSRD
jgi:phage shock protein PspC (stress-responsive transcriptional regulator)